MKKVTTLLAIMLFSAASVINSGNHKDFITYIGSKKAAFEEKFYNISIKK